MKDKKVVVLGAGLGGLSAAALLAHKGYDVKVIEKNHMEGGRAIRERHKGFIFDMGPSWYMMPEVFDNFFERVGKNREDYYKIKKMSPTYRAFFNDERYDIYSDMEKNREVFEKLERGSFERIKDILEESKFLYDKSVKDFLYRDFDSVVDFLDKEFLFNFVTKGLFRSYNSYLNNKINSEKLKQLLNWHTVFVGGTPNQVPAIFIMMLYVDLVLGTYYPEEGFHSPAKAMREVAEEYGAEFKFNEEVTHIHTEYKEVDKVITTKGEYTADIVVSNIDYKYTEHNLLKEEDRNYSEFYWDKKVMSPSCLLLYLGMDQKVDNILHHNYYFTDEHQDHFKSIAKGYWPDKPAFYVSAPSKTDTKVAGKGQENMMILTPLAPGLDTNSTQTKRIKDFIYSKMQEISDFDPKNIVYEREFAHSQFLDYYNAYKANAFGLANTLFQTGSFRPKMHSRKVENLYFSGTTTLPGVGAPLAVISGELVARKIIQDEK
jgi:phytoene desaturase